MALATTGIGDDREVERNDGAGLDQLSERRQRLAVAAVGVGEGAVPLLRRTEGALDGRTMGRRRCLREVRSFGSMRIQSRWNQRSAASN